MTRRLVLASANPSKVAELQELLDMSGLDVEVLARVTGGRADGRIVAVRQGFVLATSFHPEVTGDRRVHAYFVDMVREVSGGNRGVGNIDT